MTRQFGSSRDPEYLKNQITQTNNVLKNDGWRMTLTQLSELHQTLDSLHNRLFAVTDPQGFADAKAQWEANRNGEW